MQPEDNSDKNFLVENSLSDFKNYLLKTSSLFMDYPEQASSAVFNQEHNMRAIEAYLIDTKTPHLYFLLENGTEDLSLRTSLKDINPSQAVLYVKKGEVKFEETNMAKNFRRSFHIMNLGNITKDFNPIEVARNCVKNAFAPMLKDLANQVSDSQADKSKLVSKHAADENFLKGI